MNNSLKKKSPKESVRYLTRAEVARLLEVSPSSISRWARGGRLPFIQTIGGRRRYLKEVILALVKKWIGDQKEKRGDVRY
ncbi:MAG: helix-turn-helix domain-containing protein [Nitrospirae bacterium]|nr:helix-turn-helix domain-containing protein [Nitrospirota bacterium]